jgi:hypothetical protein
LSVEGGAAEDAENGGNGHNRKSLVALHGRSLVVVMD